MIYGRKNSPYNYGFKLELLDPIRSLACGQYALDAFNSLEIKYIQVKIYVSSNCKSNCRATE